MHEMKIISVILSFWNPYSGLHFAWRSCLSLTIFTMLQNPFVFWQLFFIKFFLESFHENNFTLNYITLVIFQCVFCNTQKKFHAFIFLIGLFFSPFSGRLRKIGASSNYEIQKIKVLTITILFLAFLFRRNSRPRE